MEAGDFVMEDEGFVLRKFTHILPVVLANSFLKGLDCVVLNECSFSADHF